MSQASQSKSRSRASAFGSVLASRLFLRKQIWIWPLLAGVVLIGIGWWVRGKVESAVKQSLNVSLSTLLDSEVQAMRLWPRR